MKKIFEPISLGNLSIKNRIIRSATVENGAANNGIMTDNLSKIYTDLTVGGVGLIITGMMGVGKNSCASESMTRVDHKEFISKFSKVVRGVHDNGSNIVVQLTHCGVKATVFEDKQLGPSDHGKAKEMSISEIESIIKDFGSAAARCKAAGADGVQIHGAHGYLISQFLSPYYNHRQDQYGGSLPNRAKFLFQVYEEIRNNVGAEFPVLIKINYSDLIDNGIEGSDALWICQELEKRGITAIEVSSGLSIDRHSAAAQIMKKNSKEGFNGDAAKDIANKVKVPIISVGGYRTLDYIEEYLNSGNVAAVSIARPFICEPNLVFRWKNGDTSAAKCISCNRCFASEQHGCPTFRKVM